MISIIVAIARGGVIGGDNKLLWHISEDLRRFKSITTGHPIIMGRKTYESIGRPLPNRDNIVVSRNRDLVIEGCKVVGSVGEAIKLYPADKELFIIGGGEIYQEALPLASKLYITRVDGKYKGDTLFPTIDHSQWVERFREEYPRGEKFEHPFSFIDYHKL